MDVKVFNEMQLKIADAYIRVSKTSMTNVVEEICQDNIQEGDPEDSVLGSIKRRQSQKSMTPLRLQMNVA